MKPVEIEPLYSGPGRATLRVRVEFCEGDYQIFLRKLRGPIQDVFHSARNLIRLDISLGLCERL